MTSSKPGDLFIYRNIGNFVPPYDSKNQTDGTGACIEYAVNILKVKEIIVCGHSSCGYCAAINSTVDEKVNPYLKNWVDRSAKTKKIVDDIVKSNDNVNAQELTEKVSVVQQLENLLTYKIVKDKVEKEEIYIHGWHMKLETGEIHYYDSSIGKFKELVE